MASHAESAEEFMRSRNSGLRRGARDRGIKKGAEERPVTVRTKISRIKISRDSRESRTQSNIDIQERIARNERIEIESKHQNTPINIQIGEPKFTIQTKS